jgi:hypothetical protein
MINCEDNELFCIDSNDLLKISLEGGKKPLFYTVAIIIVDNDINSKLVYFMFCKTLQNYIGDVCKTIHRLRNLILPVSVMDYVMKKIYCFSKTYQVFYLYM